jgi:hypothetical protein
VVAMIKLFTSYDTDKSGRIDTKEIQNAMHKEGFFDLYFNFYQVFFLFELFIHKIGVELDVDLIHKLISKLEPNKQDLGVDGFVQFRLLIGNLIKAFQQVSGREGPIG